jgi:hypothetical protein
LTLKASLLPDISVISSSFLPCSSLSKAFMWALTVVSQSFPLLPVHSRCRGCLFPLDHIQTHTTVDISPPDEGSARRRDLYLATHSQETNIHVPGGIRTHDPSKRSAARSPGSVLLLSFSLRNFQQKPHHRHIEPPHISVVNHFTISTFHFSQQYNKLQMVRALAQAGLTLFNTGVYYMNHFQTFCTQCLLTKNTADTSERSHCIKSFHFLLFSLILLPHHYSDQSQSQPCH